MLSSFSFFSYIICCLFFVFWYKYEGEATEAVEISYGYLRDHRPDLKQFVMNLLCVGDGDIPVMLEMGNGNQSDKERFAELFQKFKQQWTFEGICIADAALYSADNIAAKG